MISKENILDLNNMTYGKLIILVIVGLIVHYIIFTLLSNWPSQEDVNTFFTSCIKKCSSSTCEKVTSSARDVNYYTDLSPEQSREKSVKCAITMWEILHTILHVFIGYFYNIYIHLAISLGYEIFERYRYNCASYMDIGYNFLGFLIGVCLRGSI